MAEERIQLTLGGKYDAADAFAQMNTDVKNTQQHTKDMTQSFSSGIKQVAGQLDGELGTALNGVSNLVSGLAKGGLWGILATAAGAAITFIIDKWKEAEAAATKFSEICRTEILDAITAASNKFKDVSTEISNAKADAKDMLAILNGETASNAQMKIHQLHIDTLQQITDDMSNAAQEVIKANEKYEATIIQNTATIEEVEAATKAASDNIKLAQDKRSAAEESLASITEQRAVLEQQMYDNGNSWFAERKKILDDMSKNEYLYNEGIYDQATFLKNNKDLKVQLAQLEEKHKDELAKLTAAEKTQTEALKLVEAAKREEETANRELLVAQRKENEAKIAATSKLAEVTRELETSKKLLEKENAAKEKKIQEEELARLTAQERLDLMEATIKAEKTSLNLNIDKNYLIEEFKNLMSEGLTKEEAYNKMTQRINEILKGRQEIETACAEYGLDSAEIIATFNESMYSGNDVTTSYVEAQQKLIAAIEERAKSEEDATDENNSDTGNGKGKGKKEITVNVNASSLGDGLSQFDEKGTSWHSARKKMSDDAKELRREQKRMNTEMAPFINLLKGNLPKTQADYYVQRLNKDFSKEQLQQMYEQAMNKQMLSKSEQQKELQIFENIKNSLEKQGLK